MDLNIAQRYAICLKNDIPQKKIFLNSSTDEELKFDKSDDMSKVIEKFRIFNIAINKIVSSVDVTFKLVPYIKSSYFCIYEIKNDNKVVRLMEILDIRIDRKYQGRGIGSQIIGVLDQIVENNNIKYIIGELQEGRAGEPLDKRKKFFEKNGFTVWKDEKSKRFSGWVAKKCYNNEVL